MMGPVGFEESFPDPNLIGASPYETIGSDTIFSELVSMRDLALEKGDEDTAEQAQRELDQLREAL